MIEIVARALCVADGLNPDADCRYYDNDTKMLDIELKHPENWRSYAYQKRARGYCPNSN